MHFIRDFKQFAHVAQGIIEKELEQSPVRLQGINGIRQLLEHLRELSAIVSG